MKKLYLILSVLGALTFMCACTNEAEDLTPVATNDVASDTRASEDEMYATKTDEVTLPSTVIDWSSANYYNDPACATACAALMAKVDPENARGLHSLNITAAQVEEIKTFTQGNVTLGKTTDYNKAMAILKWVNNNVKYDWTDNDPYKVFKNRTGVCQGYAGLMIVMLHTEGIPAVMANGFMANIGGHAWVYAYVDGTWYVADPTNTPSKMWKMDETDTYKNVLQPWTIDMPLFEDDDFEYDWRDKLFQVRTIKTKGKTKVSIPFGAMGYRLTGLDPVGGISDDVRELYVSLNILSVGEYVEGLQKHGQNLEAVHIWNEKNHNINDYDGCVYTVSYKSSTKETTYRELKFVPGTKTTINVAPMKKADKNVIVNQNSLQEIHFDATTLTYCGWCVENCPNVHTIYIPMGSTVEDNAFEGCAPNLEVIEYDPLQTGIRDIRI